MHKVCCAICQLNKCWNHPGVTPAWGERTRDRAIDSPYALADKVPDMALRVRLRKTRFPLCVWARSKLCLTKLQLNPREYELDAHQEGPGLPGQFKVLFPCSLCFYDRLPAAIRGSPLWRPRSPMCPSLRSSGDLCGRRRFNLELAAPPTICSFSLSSCT